MQDLLVLGFDTGILSNGFQRPRIVDVLGDDTNGIVIDKAHDIAVIRHAEFAAFLTSNSSLQTRRSTQSARRPITAPGPGG